MRTNFHFFKKVHPFSFIAGINIFILVLISLLQFTPCSAQNKVIDSLRNALKKETDDTNKVNTLNLLCVKLWGIGSYDTSMKYANSQKALADRLSHKKGVANALRSMGIINYFQGNYSKALEYDFKALDISREMGNKNGISANLSNIGIVYWALGNYPKALEYGIKALAIKKEIGDKDGIARNLASIGNIYYSQGNYPKALVYDMKALTIFREIGNKTGIGGSYGNIGNIYFNQGDFPKALEYTLNGLSVTEEIGDKINIADNLGNLGNIYTEMANGAKSRHETVKSDSLYKKAMEYDIKALSIAKEIGDKNGISLNFCSIGNIYTLQKNYTLAKIYYDSALTLSKIIGGKERIKDSYNGLAKLDSAMGNYKEGLEDYKNSIVYRDSLINEANTKKTVQEEMSFEFEQKQAAEKAEQDKKDAVAEQDRKKQIVIRNTFIGGFVLMLTLAFFIFRGYKQKQKANEIISHQKTVVEEKQKEILDSIHYAQRIQKALLASDTLLTTYLPEYFLLYKPKDIVSGDFYWATIKDTRFYLAVCDSTGHGVPGAFMSLLNISFLNEAINEKNIREPNEVFNHARKRLIENISQEGQKDGMDGVLLYLESSPNPLQKETGMYPPSEEVAPEYSGDGGGIKSVNYAAAYNAPIIIRNNKIIELNADNMPVGGSPRENESFKHHAFTLQKGDIIYVYTDGFADQFGGDKGKKYKYKRLQEKLLAASNRPLAEQKDILNREFEEWKGSLEQVDDVLVLGIRV